MKNITEFLYDKVQVDEEYLAELEARMARLSEGDNGGEPGDPTIKDEKDFRAAAKAKFEKVFGDDLDEKKMKETIDGILKDHSDLVEKGDWAELIGILNQSFAK